MGLMHKVVVLLIVALVSMGVVAGGNLLLQGRVNQSMSVASGVQDALALLEKGRVSERSYLQLGRPELAAKAKENMVQASKRLEAISADNAVKGVTELSEQLQKYQSLFVQVEANVAEVFAARGRAIELTRQVDKVILSELVEPLTELEGKNFMTVGSGLEDDQANLRIGAKDFAAANDRIMVAIQALFLDNDEAAYLAAIKASKEERDLNQGNVINLMPRIKENQFQKPWQTVVSASEELVRKVDHLHGLWKQGLEKSVQLDKAAAELEAKASGLAVDAVAVLQANSQFSSWLGLLVSCVAGVVVLGWGLFILRSTFRPLRQAIKAMDQVVINVEASAHESSSISQELSEGATEQAASLEETAASLEELTAMTKQNAGNADQARYLMDQVQNQMENAAATMQGLNKSMTEIVTASQQISRIIRTIDEIAFQTNLLALNAAVEAARAGAAGAGFSVVAEEVRNLAQRAAEAAHSTQALIQDSMAKVQTGVSHAEQTQKAFDEMAESANKNAQLVRDIAHASQEQSEGLDQVAKAITQIDVVTQRNAAEASKGAESSDKMYEQSLALSDVVKDLTRMLHGGQSKPKPNASSDDLLPVPVKSKFLS